MARAVLFLALGPLLLLLMLLLCALMFPVPCLTARVTDATSCFQCRKELKGLYIGDLSLFYDGIA